MLLKPIDGLEVGKTYEIQIGLDRGMYGYEKITAGELLCVYAGDTLTYYGPWDSAEPDESFFDYFFVFQGIPEQIKEQVEQSITSAHFSSRSIAGPKEYADAVCGVLSGSESGLDD